MEMGMIYLSADELGAILKIVLLAWLMICVFSDLRTRTVSGWLTIPPLAGAGLWLVLRGEWLIALYLAMLVFVLPAMVNGVKAGVWGIVALGLAGVIRMQANIPLMLALTAVFMLWWYGGLGGADVRVMMFLVIMLSPMVLLPISLAGGVQALVATVRKKRTIPYMVAIAVGTVAMLFL